jgi:hypothetical protein
MTPAQIARRAQAWTDAGACQDGKVAGSPSGGPSGPVRAAVPGRLAIRLLGVMAVLLMLIPVRFVIVGGLASAEAPTALLGDLALFLWFLGRIHPHSQLASGRQPIRTLLLLLLAWLVVAWSWAWHRVLLPQEVAGANRQFLLFCGLIGAGLLAADGLADRDQIRRLVDLLCYGGYVSALVGMGQRFGHYDAGAIFTKVPGLVLDGHLYQDFVQRGGRANGTASHAIEFAVVCVALLPLAIHRAHFSERRNLRQVHVVGALLLCAGALLSVSRTAFIDLGLVLVLYVTATSGRRQANVLAGGLLGLGLVVAVAPSAISEVATLFGQGGNDPSVQGRTSDYSAVGSLIHSHEWMGIGFGTYQPTIYRILDNQYLGTLIEGGIVGLVLLVAFYASGVLIGQQARFEARRDPELRDLAHALSIGVLVLGISAAFFDEFAFRQSTNLLFVLLGLEGALWRVAQTGDVSEKDSSGTTATEANVTRMIDLVATT